jgi:hypothetical protein
VITWQRQGQFIQQYGNPNLRLLAGGKQLLIVNAQLHDLGDYTCYVENVAGNISQEYFVNVYGKQQQQQQQQQHIYCLKLLQMLLV